MEKAMGARRVVVSAGIAAAALLIAATAAADTYSFRLTASDQAAARAVVVRRADLGTGAPWKGGLVKPDRSALQCANYNPKHGDLVVTGIAQAHWTASGIQIDSSAAIFQTDDMVRVDWQRSDSSGLLPCLRTKLEHSLGATGRLVSLRRIPFPSVSTLTDAFRAVVDVTASGRTVRVLIDTVFVARNRAEIQLSTVAPYALVAQVQAAEARLAVLMAGRAPAF
jgi:hypothetical protein